MIAVIDYKTGNLKSLCNALDRLSCNYIITNNIENINSATKVILPGVGDASFAMENIRNLQLEKIICNLKVPTLGICLGMQIMCKESQEGNCKCLGIFNNSVKRFNENLNIKIPQMGWNNIELKPHKLFDNIPNNSYFYFVHSYCANINENTFGTTLYGEEFSSILIKDNFIGCQFHPEKSGDIGEKLLFNFLNL